MKPTPAPAKLSNEDVAEAVQKIFYFMREAQTLLEQGKVAAALRRSQGASKTLGFIVMNTGPTIAPQVNPQGGSHGL